ncbi:MAG: hypothetical protein ABI621_05940 [Chloroflexota bacterium]
MKGSPENLVRRRPSAWRQGAKVAAVIAVIQACLTIEGRGIEGFIVAVILIFLAYWLFFTFIVWLWRRRTGRYT